MTTWTCALRGILILAASLGVATALPAAARASDHLMKVNEVMVSAGGNPAAQFVELHDPFDEPFPAPPYRLVVFDANGTRLDAQDLGPGAIIDNGVPMLISTAAANTTLGVTGDRALIVALPIEAGQISFTRGLTETKIHTFTWGCINTPVSFADAGPAPPDGQSAQRQANGSVTLGAPTPKAANSAGTAAVACTPAAPSFTATDPASPANDNNPKIKGTAGAGSTVRLYTAMNCSGSPVATGTAAQFASPGLAVSVADNSTTTFYGTAALQGGTSSCSTSSIAYTEFTPPQPPAPTFSATDPSSPANDNNPKVKGMAPVDSTVSIYTNASCAGSPVATGTTAEFASPGLAVPVADNSTTTFYGTAINQGVSSSCSTSSIAFVEVSPTPGNTMPGNTLGPPAGGASPVGGAAILDTSGPTMAVAGEVVKMDSGGAVRLLLSCPSQEPGGCAGTVSLETLGKVRVSKVGTTRTPRKRKVMLGKSSFQVAGGKSSTVKVRPSKQNQRLVRKLKKVRVLAVVEARDRTGNAQTTKQRLTLRAAARKRTG